MSEQQSYKERVSAFWDDNRAEYAWWCQQYGPAVGATLFWQLAEVRWNWETTVKGWAPKDEWWEVLHAEALLMNETGGHTDGVWTYDDPTKVVPMSYVNPELLESTYDKSWVTYKVPDTCPF